MVFAVVEQKEPHAGRMAFADVTQPANFAERCALARRLRDELEVPLPIYVDGMDDASRALFSDLPSPAFLLDRQGRIADKLPWADPEPLDRAIQGLLVRDPLPAERTAPWTLDERAGFAARELAGGNPEAALAWLDAVSTPPPSVPPTAVATALAALVRAAALAKASPDARIDALTAAETALEAAWPQDAGRRLAARVQLAEAAAGLRLAETCWRKALAELDSKAPALTRQWLQARQPTEKPR